MTSAAARQRRFRERDARDLRCLTVVVHLDRLAAVLEDAGKAGSNPSKAELEAWAAAMIEDWVTRYEKDRWGLL